MLTLSLLVFTLITSLISSWIIHCDCKRISMYWSYQRTVVTFRFWSNRLRIYGNFQYDGISYYTLFNTRYPNSWFRYAILLQRNFSQLRELSMYPNFYITFFAFQSFLTGCSGFFVTGLTNKVFVENVKRVWTVEQSTKNHWLADWLNIQQNIEETE